MNAREILHKELLILCEEIERILSDRIRHYGLQDSKLAENMSVTPNENGLALQIADYWEYVALGWKRTHNPKFKGTFSQYIENISKWITEKGIQWGNMTHNQMVWALANRMFNERNHYTIAPRPFLVWNEEGDIEKMIPTLERYMNEWFDKLFNDIINDLNKFFN